MSKNRRNFTPSFKAQVVLEVISGVKSAAEVCREYQINPQLFSQWKSHLLNNAASLFDGTARRSAEQARIEEVEQTKQNRSQSSLTKAFFVSKKRGALHTMAGTKDHGRVQHRILDLLKSLRGENQLRELCRELNYDYCNTPFSPRNWRSTAAQKLLEEKRLAPPVLIARHDDFRIIYTRLHANELSLGHERLVISQLLHDYPYALFVFSNSEQDRWHFVNVKFHEQVGHRHIFRRIAVGGHDRLHTAAKRIAMLDIETINPQGPLDIQKVHDEAFDVEAVTEKFYHGDERSGEKGYKHVFQTLQQDLLKQNQNADRRWAHDYALQFLNRTMFLYFVQRKNWLGDDAEFLRSFWQSYRKAGRPKDSFFAEWLSVLFFEAFNRPPDARKIDCNFFAPRIRDTLKRAPFLNGGLFNRNELDTPPGLKFTITDAVFENVFSFLERHDFTVAQESPIDQEIAVDPQMIGSVYETLVNVSVELEEQGEAGVFFTPRLEIDVMCRLALVDCLANHLGQQHKPLLYESIFAMGEDEKALADHKLAAAKLWPDFATRLRELTVLDPACGSGSFLVGMLYVLDDLHERANHHLDKREDRFERKQRIIAENLYGVDVMKWATQVAEWRLWLNLMVDAPANLKASEKALLPHFACKIRCGDSLVQEFGGITLGYRSRQHELPSELQKQVAHLKQQKLDYYYNRSERSYADIIKRENQLYLQLLEKRREAVAQEIKRLQQRLTGPTGYQLRLDGTTESSSHRMESQAGEWQRQLAALQAEFANIGRMHEAVKQGDEDVFVWDIAFAEIFAGEKRGFDIVVGNPPYVRQEKIASPRLERWEVNTGNKKDYKTRLARSVYQLYPNFFGYKPAEQTASRKLDGKSDLYVYFYFHALSLLNRKGSLCFITSNSWLDVGYGAELQEFLLKHCHVKIILDNQIRRSFRQADVNTVIVLFSPPHESSEWGLEQTARFVMLKAPFESLFTDGLLQEIEATPAGERRTTPIYRVHAARQQTLLEAGLKDAQGNQTCGSTSSGLDKTTVCKPDFVSPGPLIKVARYLGDKWGGKYLRAPDIYWTIIKKAGQKLMSLDSFCSIEGYIHDNNTGKHFPRVLFVKSIKNLDKIHLTASSSGVVSYGVKSTGNSRIVSPILFPRTFGSRHLVAWNSSTIYGKEFYKIIPKSKALVIPFVAQLNSTFAILQREIIGLVNLGDGALKFSAYDLKSFLVLPDIKRDVIEPFFRPLAERSVLAMPDELHQNDRKDVDRVIFDVIGLSQSECEAVYDAALNLIEARLKKSDSLKTKNRQEHEYDDEMETANAELRQSMQKAGKITKGVKAA